VVTVAVTGEVDLRTAPAFADALAEAGRLATERVEVDLSAVDFLAVSGAAALARAAEEAVLRVHPASHASLVVLRAAGLDHLIV